MTALERLKECNSLGDVAKLLSYTPRAFAYLVRIKPTQNKYKQFTIPKKSGGTRTINAPSPDLKLLQSRLSEMLQDCWEEISGSQKLTRSIAHGFVRGHSILSNAQQHKNRQFVFNIDLEDFFGSVNFGRVRGFFISNREFALSEPVATILAQIACHQNSLPQGSPCSPVISNLIGHILDIRLVSLARENGCTYTRYADDLTFSTNKRAFPSQIAKLNEGREHEWIPSEKLTQLIVRSGFRINPQKTRMQYRDSRQEVTGLVVNKKVNVPVDYRRVVRAMSDTYFKTGSFFTLQPGIGGAMTKVAGTPNELNGRLNFINSVDLYNAERNKEFALALSSKERTYKRFLYFENFFCAEKPVIVCEGKTDYIYLRSALRRLADQYPRLATADPDGVIELGVRLYKYDKTNSGRILGIRGGTADLCTFMRNYFRECVTFNTVLRRSPVLILVDNDDGSNTVFNTIKGPAKRREAR